MGASMPDDFEAMWRGPGAGGAVGVRPAATSASPGPRAETELRAWFVAQAAARGLVGRRTDGVGNMVAWWAPPGASGPGVLTGSHLDSVLDGGAYDGPLGVVSALAARRPAARARVRAGAADRGVGVRRGGGLALRAGLPGLPAGRGALDWAAARELRDRDGVALPDALAACRARPRVDAGPGAGPGLDGSAASSSCTSSRAATWSTAGAAVGVASGIWPHGRYRFDFTGEANHAGTTRMEDRARPDADLRDDRAGREQAGRGWPASGRRSGGVEVAPNGTNAIPSRVTAWLDARCGTDDALAELVEAVARQAAGAGRGATGPRWR